MATMSSRTATTSTVPASEAAEQWEAENVHNVYSSIASHFSATRYKPWPLVTFFLATLPPGSIGIDVGCGNGKYLHLRNSLHRQSDSYEEQSSEAGPSRLDCLTIGVDRSPELVSFAKTMTLKSMSPRRAKEPKAKGAEGPSASALPLLNEVAVGDAITSGFQSGSFDYAISIATIHHLSTRQRRRESIQELIRLVKPRSSPTDNATKCGRFLVYVWALEQKGQERRKFDEDDEKQRTTASQEEDSSSLAPTASVKEGRDVMVPWVLKATKDEATGEETQEKVYQRCE